MIKKRCCIVEEVNINYWRTSNKFGIRIPNIVKESYSLDK